MTKEEVDLFTAQKELFRAKERLAENYKTNKGHVREELERVFKVVHGEQLVDSLPEDQIKFQHFLWELGDNRSLDLSRHGFSFHPNYVVKMNGQVVYSDDEKIYSESRAWIFDLVRSLAVIRTQRVKFKTKALKDLIGD